MAEQLPEMTVVFDESIEYLISITSGCFYDV